MKYYSKHDAIRDANCHISVPGIVAEKYQLQFVYITNRISGLYRGYESIRLTSVTDIGAGIYYTAIVTLRFPVKREQGVIIFYGVDSNTYAVFNQKTVIL